MAEKPRRVGDYKTDIGLNIEAIKDKEVVIAAVVFEERELNGEPRTLSLITIDDTLYHSWSPVIARDLARVPEDAFPITALFKKVKTKNNREAWVVE